MEKIQHALEKLIDHQISAFIPMLRQDGVIPIVIRALEDSGIWIENDHIVFGTGTTHSVYRNPGKPFEPLEDLPRTVCFFPWQQIGYLLVGDELDPHKDSLRLLHFNPRSDTPSAAPPHPGEEATPPKEL